MCADPVICNNSNFLLISYSLEDWKYLSFVTMWYFIHLFECYCLLYFFPGLMVFFRPSEDVALPDFFHSLFSVCVYMWTCLCIVRSSFKMHIHTLVHTCILPKLTRPVCHTPNHDYKLKCEELFCFLVLALFYTCTLTFFMGFHKMSEHQSTFCVLPQIGTSLPRGALVHERRPKQTQIESRICAWLFHVFYLTFKQIAFHVRNIYCEGLLMCMSNYF